MQDDYLMKIWQANDSQIDHFLEIDESAFEKLQHKKAKSQLNKLIVPKLTGILLGLGWIAFMMLLISLSMRYSPASSGKIFFIGSLGVIAVTTAVAVFLYVRDLYAIRQIGNDDSVVAIQQKLAGLQCSVINSVRIMWLQLPFYTTWYLNYDMLLHGSVLFRIVQLLVTGGAVWLSVWLFRNIRYENRHKKRVWGFMRGYGFSSVSRAIAYMNEIEHFKAQPETEKR
jgi:hypothetical protein